MKISNNKAHIEIVLIQFLAFFILICLMTTVFYRCASGYQVNSSSKEETQNKILSHMFKHSRLDLKTEKEITYQLLFSLTQPHKELNGKSIYYINSPSSAHQTLIKKLKLYSLSRAIHTVTDDADRINLLTAIVHVETDFINRKSERGARGYFQILPSTAKIFHPNMNYKELLYRIEHDNIFSASLANAYLSNLFKSYKTLERSLFHYNRCKIYVKNVLKVYNQLRRS